MVRDLYLSEVFNCLPLLHIAVPRACGYLWLHVAHCMANKRHLQLTVTVTRCCCAEGLWLSLADAGLLAVAHNSTELSYLLRNSSVGQIVLDPSGQSVSALGF